MLQDAMKLLYWTVLIYDMQEASADAVLRRCCFVHMLSCAHA